MPRSISQVDFARFVARLAPEKETIQNKLAEGATQVEMADHYKIPVSTFRDLCKVLEIDCRKHGTADRAKLPPLLIQDILTALVRIGAAVDDKCPEIQKYLQPTK